MDELVRRKRRSVFFEELERAAASGAEPGAGGWALANMGIGELDAAL
jgi:hypothetical protein